MSFDFQDYDFASILQIFQMHRQAEHHIEEFVEEFVCVYCCHSSFDSFAMSRYV